MGKRGVIILIIVVSIISFLLVKNPFSEPELMEVSQVTGCTVDGYCGGSIEDTEKSFTLLISSEQDNEFKSLYEKNKEKEFLLCLEGDKKRNTYQLTDYYEPSYLEEKDGKAIYSSCKNTSIGTLHNHYNPTNNEFYCQLSARDIYTFGQGGEDLMGIICGNKYVFIHKSDLKPTNIRIT